MTVRYDFHLHSDFSGDCDTPAVQMAEQARRTGLEGLCFTEHYDPDFPVQENDFSLDFEGYFHSAAELRRRYEGSLWIGTGMEFGIQPHLGQTLSSLAAQYPFDFIIVSQHILNRQDPYYPEYFSGRTEHACYTEFLQAQYTTLKCFDPASFDTLGHLDYIVRYGPNKNLCYSYEKYADCIDPVLRFLIENGKCLELNTGGFKYGLGEPNPCTGVLRRYRELGGELITIGSDAHLPQHLCYDFDKAATLLQELGFRYYTVFQNRTPHVLPLE